MTAKEFFKKFSYKAGYEEGFKAGRHIGYDEAICSEIENSFKPREMPVIAFKAKRALNISDDITEAKKQAVEELTRKELAYDLANKLNDSGFISYTEDLLESGTLKVKMLSAELQVVKE